MRVDRSDGYLASTGPIFSRGRGNLEIQKENELTRVSLSEQVVLYVANWIRAHNLKPGDFLPSETSLAEQIGISRPVVREALRSLSSLGIIKTAAGKRATLCPVGSRAMGTLLDLSMTMQGVTVRETLELREGLEIEAAGLAAINLREDEATNLRNILAKMAAVRGDPDRYALVDLELHMAIAQASRNRLIVAFLEAVRSLSEESMRVGSSIANKTEWLAIQRYHERLVTAIISGDASEAQRIVKLQLNSALHRINRPRLS